MMVMYDVNCESLHQHISELIGWAISVYAMIEDKPSHSVKNSVCCILHIAM